MNDGLDFRAQNYIDRSLLMNDLLNEGSVLAIADEIALLADERQVDYEPLDYRSISQEAWDRVASINLDPWRVFAHEEILCDIPTASQYYRGMTLLSRKGVQSVVGSIDSWEDPGKVSRVSKEKAIAVARLYNVLMSRIVEQTENWDLEDGLRNIVATTAIGYDGTWRNHIGKMAEQKVWRIITEFLQGRFEDWHYSQEDIRDSFVELPTDPGVTVERSMKFGSEPDVSFIDNDGSTVATIEIKGGMDPAGALERFGAMRKSFEETPGTTANFLILGVVTDEVKRRLEDPDLTVISFVLGDLDDKTIAAKFLDELFHYAVRIIRTPITEEDLP